LKKEDYSRKHKEIHFHRIEYDAYSDIRTYKHYKPKKEYESVLIDEIKKVEEASTVQKKLKRDDSDYTADEEESFFLERRSYILTVINTSIQDNLTPVETQPVAKYLRILYDDY
jgi:hypothetical protein